MDKSIRAKRNMLEQHSDKIAEEGRGEDDVIGHLTKGEVVIPKQFMEDPQVAEMVNEIFAAYEVNVNQYTVGHEENSINPNTGNPEFLRIRIRIRTPKFVKQALGTLAGAGLGFLVGGPGGAVKGAQVGAGVDVARATYSAAETAQRESQAARAQAATESAAAVSAMESQAAAQREQAAVARQRLEAETAKFAEERAKLEAEAKRRSDELEAAQREMGERESSRLRASRRSGRRSLLSQARLSPELGLNSGGTSLSPTTQTTRMM
jgi:hypothetical protein